MSENLGFLAGRKGVDHSLFERVVQIAKQEGTPGSEQMRSLAKEFLFGDASVYGTASFYDFTREENKGVQVRVCNGSACLVAGTQPALKKSLERTFSESQIGHICCLGRCQRKEQKASNEQDNGPCRPFKPGQICNAAPEIHTG